MYVYCFVPLSSLDIIITKNYMHVCNINLPTHYFTQFKRVAYCRTFLSKLIVVLEAAENIADNSLKNAFNKKLCYIYIEIVIKQFAIRFVIKNDGFRDFKFFQDLHG